MRKFESLTNQDYIEAKTNEKVFEKVFMSHIKLITVCKKRIKRIQLISDYEYEDALRDGLYKAIMAFDPSRGYKFASMAVVYMLNQVKNLTRNRLASRDVCDQLSTSSVETLFELYENKNSSWEDFLVDEDFEDEQIVSLEDRLNVENFSQLLREKEQRVFLLMLKDKNIIQIAKEIGVTKQRISQMRCKIGKKLNNIPKFAKIIHSMKTLGVSNEEIVEKLNLRSAEVVDYYEEVFLFLYLDGKKPSIKYMWLANPCHPKDELEECERE